MEKTFQVFQCIEKTFHHCFTANHMVAAPLPPNFRGVDLKISDQNNWGDLSNDVMVVVLKDIILLIRF